MTKTFVLTKTTERDYSFEDQYALCTNFVRKQLGLNDWQDVPKNIAVTVSKHRFFKSKRVYVSAPYNLWRWGTPRKNGWGNFKVPTYNGGVFSNAMRVLAKYGLIRRASGSMYQAIYVRISPLTGVAESV